MSAADLPEQASPGEGTSLRELLRCEGWAVLGIATATIAIELGSYFLARGMHVGQARAVLTALGTTALWIALACPITTCGSANAWGAMLRGGSVIDASGVTLIVLWLLAHDPRGRPYVTLLSALKIYCTCASVGLFAIAVVSCATRPSRRYVLGVAVAVLLVVCLGTPFWTGGIFELVPPRSAQTLARWVLLVNPFCSITSVVSERMRFVWYYDGGLLYRVSRLGGDVIPPPVRWYSAAVGYAALAGLFALIALARRRAGRETSLRIDRIREGRSGGA